MKTYIFAVEVEQEDDGRWSADVPTLPGCAAWGYTKEEALEAIQDTAKAFLQVMMEYSDPLPPEAEDKGATSGSEFVTFTL